MSDDESLSRARWTTQEQAQIQDMKWWSVGHLGETSERVLPRVLSSRLPEILAGCVPAEPELIDLG